MADKELRETYSSLVFIISWFMNHVDLFKTLNLIKGSKGKVKFIGYRGNRMSQEKKTQRKEAYQTEDYHEGIAEEVRTCRETLFIPCRGAENA